MSSGRAGANGISAASLIGAGIEAGYGCVAWVFLGFQNDLFAILFAKSVRNSIRTHHSAEMKDPPNVNRM